jgi:hypothetical protein
MGDPGQEDDDNAERNGIHHNESTVRPRYVGYIRIYSSCHEHTTTAAVTNAATGS